MMQFQQFERDWSQCKDNVNGFSILEFHLVLQNTVICLQDIT